MSPFIWITRFFTTYFKKFYTTYIAKFFSFGFSYQAILVYVSSVALILTGFYSAISVLLFSLSLVFPPQYLDLGAVFIPTNLHLCVSIILTARFLVIGLNWTLKFHTRFLYIALYGTPQCQDQKSQKIREKSLKNSPILD